MRRLAAALRRDIVARGIPARARAAGDFMRIAWGGVAILAVGIGMLVAGWMLTAPVLEMTRGPSTQGEVVAIERSSSRGRSTWRPVVAFATERGSFRVAAMVWSSSQDHAVGDRVRVFYDPERPSDALIDSFMELWFWALFFAAIGIPACLVALIMLYRGATGRRVW